MKLFMSGTGNRLAIVDAFAGAGRDRLGRDGSPLIAVTRAREAMRAAQNRKPHLSDPKVEVFAIEKHRGRFQSLRETLEPLRHETPDLIHVLEGELNDHIDVIRNRINDAPAFFFLDPFGIKGLDARTYPLALAGPHNEIFALFAGIGAVRLHGVITSERGDADAVVEKIREAPTLFPEMDAAAIEAARADAARIKEALDASIPASREYLTRALGGEHWIRHLESGGEDRRADAFVELFAQALVRAGAHHVLPIPIRNDAGHPVYALVYASHSPTGLVTMKEAVSSGLNRSELSAESRNAIRADLSLNIPSLVAWLRKQLAGLTVPWADERRGLKRVLLVRTPLFQFQARELKAALKGVGILQRADGKEVCIFPQ